MFDKKVIRKSLTIIFLIILILIGITFIRRTFSRYESNAKSVSGADMAFWVVNDSLTTDFITIGELETMPNGISDEEKETYKRKVEFTVQNFKDTITASVPLKYQIKLITTTNMPLKYELYQYADDDIIKPDPCIFETNIVTDDDTTYYKELTAKPMKSGVNDFFFDGVYEVDSGEFITGKEIDKFLLKVWLPNVDDTENYMFADLLEYVKIEITAEQITTEDIDV